MAFGIQVRTSTGMKDVSELQGARLIRRVHGTEVSGSVHIPEWNNPTGDFVMFNLNTSTSERTQMPYVHWNNDTKILAWEKWNSNHNDEGTSNNFLIMCYEV